MNWEYDDKVDGLYIWFVENIEEEKENYKGEIWPVELNGEIGLLFDNEKKLMGLEIQPATKYFDEKRLNRLSEKKH